MKDISLDQEIKKDKEKRQQQRPKKPNQNRQTRKPKFAPNRKENRPRPVKRFQNQRIQRRPRQSEIPSNYNERKLKVMGIHPDITSEDLYKLFSEQGALQVCRVDQDNFGRSQTTATIIYHTVQSAQQAIQKLNKHKIMNSIITVEKWKRQPKVVARVERTYEQQNNNGEFERNRSNGNRQNGKRVFRGRFNRRFNRRER